MYSGDTLLDRQRGLLIRQVLTLPKYQLLRLPHCKMRVTFWYDHTSMEFSLLSLLYAQTHRTQIHYYWFSLAGKLRFAYYGYRHFNSSLYLVIRKPQHNDALSQLQTAERNEMTVEEETHTQGVSMAIHPKGKTKRLLICTWKTIIMYILSNQILPVSQNYASWLSSPIMRPN